MRGQSKRVVLEGTDFTFDCGMAHDLFSWTASSQVGKGGYKGADRLLFGAAIASGAGGQFVLLVTANMSTTVDMLLQPSQDARIDGDRALPTPPTWGSGSFTIGEGASLAVSYL